MHFKCACFECIKQLVVRMDIEDLLTLYIAGIPKWDADHGIFVITLDLLGI
jgi:hypothetical protein